jgi:hypothetical protein
MRILLLYLLMAGWLWAGMAQAQTPLPALNRVEYFIDADPGYGAATSVTFTPATSLTGLSFDVPVREVATGFHWLFVRVQNSNNQWSVVSDQPFYKDALTATPASVSRIEYFIDADPGYGAATSVTFTPATTPTDIPFTVPLANVPTGIHTLFVRAQNAEGRWSVVARQPFYKDDIGQPNITRIEYFVDNDPGLGAATSVSVTPGTSVNNLGYTVPLTGLANGPHRLFVRAQNALGRWSVMAIRDFVVQDNVITVSGQPEWCRRASYTINFTATGTYPTGNIFTAQLSNPSGDFSTFTNVGTLTGTTSGSIVATLPNGVAAGTGYRLRVVSSNPSLSNMPSMAVAISETCLCTHTARIEAPGGTDFCAGSSVVVTGSAAGGTGPFTYRWRLGNSNLVSVASLTATQAGTYLVDVTATNGCVSTASVNVTQAPNLAVSLAGATSFCAGQTVPLSASVSGGNGTYTYLWRLNGGTIAGAAGSQYQINAGGTYSVQATDGRGCTGTSVNLGITQRPSPNATVTANGPTALTPGASVVLSVPAAAGQTYLWQRDGTAIGGAITNSFTATQAGSYVVVVTGGGCPATSTATVVSIILATEPVVVGLSLEVSPNPANGLLRAVLTLDEAAPATLRLFDSNGRQLQSQHFGQPQRTHEARFDLTNVPSGILYLRAEVGEKQLTKKIVNE